MTLLTAVRENELYIGLFQNDAIDSCQRDEPLVQDYSRPSVSALVQSYSA